MRTFPIFLTGLLSGAFIFSIYWDISTVKKPTKVHTLDAPLVLVGNQPTTILYLLLGGTTLYFDRSFP